MPVVNVNSDLFPATPLATNAPDPSKARGRVIVATFSVSNLATDSNLSRYKLATIPADAIWDEATSFKVDGWGFAAIRIGTKTDVGALASVLKTAGTFVNPVQVGDAKHGLPIWQALGMARPPENGLIEIYAHAIADATGAGVMRGKIAYRFR